MKLIGKRHGFMTNSSSSHFIVFTNRHMSDDLPRYEFGWEDFTLVSPRNKAIYWLSVSKTVLGSFFYELWNHPRVQKIAGAHNIQMDDLLHVDHNSLIYFLDVETRKLNKDIGIKNMEPVHKWDWDLIFSTVKRHVEEPLHCSSFSIDTALARMVKTHLQKYGVPEHLYYLHEGIVSKYVDLVEKYIAPSSYETDKRVYFKDVDDLCDKITTNFNS